jgi:hypothetical protein
LPATKAAIKLTVTARYAWILKIAFRNISAETVLTPALIDAMPLFLQCH